MLCPGPLEPASKLSQPPLRSGSNAVYLVRSMRPSSGSAPPKSFCCVFPSRRCRPPFSPRFVDQGLGNTASNVECHFKPFQELGAGLFHLFGDMKDIGRNPPLCAAQGGGLSCDQSIALSSGYWARPFARTGRALCEWRPP